MINAVTGRSPRCSRYRRQAAAAVSLDIRGSMTMTPVSLSTSDMLDRSKPADLVDALGHLEQAVLGHELPCRHRLGLAVAGASPVRKSYLAQSQTTCPSAAMITGSLQRADEPPLDVLEVAAVVEVETGHAGTRFPPPRLTPRAAGKSGRGTRPRGWDQRSS